MASSFSAQIFLEDEGRRIPCGLSYCKVPLQELVQKCDTFLHPNELAYFQALSFEKRQHSYLLGRYAAKMAVRAHLGSNALDAILIQPGIFQQPIVTIPGCANVQVSITHTQDVGGALSFPEAYPLALDIELIDEERMETIKTQLTTKEQALYDPSLGSKISFLTTLWAAKEALSKALKGGFLISFEVLEVSKIVQTATGLTLEFSHFFHYQAHAFEWQKRSVAIVYPKKTTLVSELYLSEGGSLRREPLIGCFEAKDTLKR